MTSHAPLFPVPTLQTDDLTDLLSGVLNIHSVKASAYAYALDIRLEALNAYAKKEHFRPFDALVKQARLRFGPTPRVGHLVHYAGVKDLTETLKVQRAQGTNLMTALQSLNWCEAFTLKSICIEPDAWLPPQLRLLAAVLKGDQAHVEKAFLRYLPFGFAGFPFSTHTLMRLEEKGYDLIADILRPAVFTSITELTVEAEGSQLSVSEAADLWGQVFTQYGLDFKNRPESLHFYFEWFDLL